MTLPAGFVRPFHLDKYCPNSYIWDANNLMACDFVDYDEEENDLPPGTFRLRPRGWGRMSYLPGHEAQMDAWADWVADTVGNKTDPATIIELMNKEHDDT